MFYPKVIVGSKALFFIIPKIQLFLRVLIPL